MSGITDEEKSSTMQLHINPNESEAFGRDSLQSAFVKEWLINLYRKM